jgi:uncharacterized protein
MERETTFNLQLVITEECNLRCAYCFEIDKVSRRMPIDLAKEILDRELSQPGDYHKYQIDISGGEPFLHFDYLKAIVDYGVGNAPRWGKRLYFFIGSNLTLLTPEVEKWLEETRDFVILGISLDGTKEAHDRCRCNSYDAVVRNIPFFKKHYPRETVKMTISADTVGDVYEGIKNIESLELALSANVVFEPVWGDGPAKRSLLAKFAEQLDLLIEHYLENPELKIPTILSLPIRLVIAPPNPQHRWCGSGVTMRCYDTDGRPLPCHRFSRFSTRKIYEGQQSVGQRITTKCDACRFIAACPTCAGFNWQVNGHPDSRTSYHCEFIKLQLLAAAKLKYRQNESLVDRLANGVPETTEKMSSEYRDALLDLQASHLIMSTLDVDKILSDV